MEGRPFCPRFPANPLITSPHAPSLEQPSNLAWTQQLSALPKTQHSLLIGMIHSPVTWERWPEAKALLDPALMRGDEAWPAVEARLQTNEQQLWAVMEGGDLLAAAVTRVALSRDGEVAEIYLVGGHDFTRWIAELDATIEASARNIGCIGMRAYGREGWRKTLGGLGWRVSAVAFQRDFA